MAREKAPKDAPGVPAPVTCPGCNGDGCNDCGGKGWVTVPYYEF